MEELTGKVFDIRRFSTHDGSGIRTVMFMQGCSLRCAWCHNPEGIDQGRRAMWFQSRCIRCRACLSRSLHGGLALQEDEIVIHPEAAEDWDGIIDSCASGALRWNYRELSVSDAVQELIKDQPFFAHGGGITFSGGEPLLQKDFVLAVLKEMKQRQIQTAIETALNVPWENVAEAIPYLDIIYADLKILDDSSHRRYIGFSNERILRNIRNLLQSEAGSRVIIRTPMIPGMTAEEENIAGIAGFISSVLPDVRYELLNYNPLAGAKYHLVGRKYCFEKNPEKYTAAEMRHFAEIADRSGVRNTIAEV